MTSIRQRIGAVAADAATPLVLLRAYLTPQQLEFIDDPHRYKLARCTRRAGKTAGVAAYLIIACLTSAKMPTLYAGLTRDSAKEAVWEILLDMLERFGIRAKVQPSALRITFANGSFIQLFGCDQQNARNRLRGRKFRLVCFDETAFYSALDPLVYAVLPALADVSGTLCLTSSPGELLDGLFYEADQGRLKDDWHQYTWSIHDNPLFAAPSVHPEYVGKTRADEELGTVLKFQFKGNTDHPSYRREWLGEWVRNATTLVYPVTGANLIAAPYPMPMHEHAIGIAVGPFTNAIVVGRYSEHSRDLQFVDAKEIDGDVDRFAAVIMSAIGTYSPTVIVAHLGDYTADVVKELTRRYQLPISHMKDTDRSFHQRLFATDLAAGYIKMVNGTPLVDRCGRIVKDLQTGDELKGQANWSPLAALALYRRIYTTHLSTFVKPLTEEERHIAALEASQFDVITPWYEQIA